MSLHTWHVLEQPYLVCHWCRFDNWALIECVTKTPGLSVLGATNAEMGLVELGRIMSIVACKASLVAASKTLNETLIGLQAFERDRHTRN